MNGFELISVVHPDDIEVGNWIELDGAIVKVIKKRFYDMWYLSVKDYLHDIVDIDIPFRKEEFIGVVKCKHCAETLGGPKTDKFGELYSSAVEIRCALCGCDGVFVNGTDCLWNGFDYDEDELKKQLVQDKDYLAKQNMRYEAKFCVACGEGLYEPYPNIKYCRKCEG